MHTGGVVFKGYTERGVVLIGHNAHRRCGTHRMHTGRCIPFTEYSELHYSQCTAHSEVHFLQDSLRAARYITHRMHSRQWAALLLGYTAHSEMHHSEVALHTVADITHVTQ